MSDSTRQGESDNATVTDNINDNGQPQEPQQRQISPREQAMNAVIEKQQAEREEEANYLEQAKPRPQHLDNPVYQNESGEYLMRLKVDGQETEIPVSQVQATYQKNQAADERLRQAAEWKAQLDAKERELNERYNQLPANQAPEAKADDPDLLEQAHTIIDQLYDGDPEDAAKALAEAMGQNRSTITPEQIQQETYKALEQKAYQENLQDGFKQFEQEYSDIMADDLLRGLADQKTMELKQLHPDWSPAEILMESGRAIREWRNGGQSPQPADTSREARKQQLPTMPQRQASSAYIPPGKQQPSNTPADVIGRMKQARGQF